MGDHQGGNTAFAQNSGRAVAHLVAQLGVEPRKRFVEQDHPRSRHDSTGQGNPLLLAAAELMGKGIGPSLQPGAVERPLGSRPLVGRRNVAQTERDVVAHRQMRKQRKVLKDQSHVALFRRHRHRAVRHGVGTDRHPPLLEWLEARRDP